MYSFQNINSSRIISIRTFSYVARNIKLHNKSNVLTELNIGM